MNFLLNDRNILTLIIINSIIIFCLGFDLSHQTNSILHIIDNSISTLFVAEVIVKIKKYGSGGYFSKGWNIFDFLLVLISIPSLLVFMGLEVSDMSYLLVFRTLRVFKVFRFFRFIPNIDRLLQGIIRALKSSLLILVSFTLYIFIVGILSHSIFGYSDLFSDPGTSMYTILKVFTLEGWYEFPDELTENATMLKVFFIRLYFILILISGGIFGLSLVNSIFVHSMVDTNEKLEEKVDELKKMIKDIDDKINK